MHQVTVIAECSRGRLGTLIVHCMKKKRGKKPLSFLFFNVVKYLCMYIGSSMMSAFHFWQAWTADEVTAHAWCGAPRNKPRF